MPSIHLKSGREKSVLQHHPWIFSGSIKEVRGNPSIGETVRVLSSRGEFIAWAAYSPHSSIRARIWTWDTKQVIDPDFFRNQIKQAIAYRDEIYSFGGFNPPLNSGTGEEVLPEYTPAYRLIYGESDRLPGLVVDRYHETLVIQVLSAGIENWRDTIADILLEETGADRIYERSDVDIRSLEGLRLRKGPLRGDEPPDLIEIYDSGLRFLVDVKDGQKTGYYLDQRDNRLSVRALSKDRRVLDGFAYTGGFAANVIVGGAKNLTVIDSSADALALARENISLNQVDSKGIEWINGDVFQELRRFRDQDRQYDLIILDPPKFAPTPAHIHKASRGYKDINLLAFKLLEPGGNLVTFSCSGGVDMDLFQKIVADAALDAEVNARVVRQLHQSWDHPIALNFPEGAYLKGLIIKVY